MPFSLILYPYKLYKLRKSQWQCPAKLKNLQVKKLRVLVQHVYYKVDYYRKLFDQVEIKPEDIKTIQDLVKIPITTRKELQSLPKRAVIAKDIELNRCLNLRTSGSTGMPLDIFLGNREIISRRLSYRTMFSENGCKFTDKIATIASPHNFKISKKWFKRLGILQERHISIFEETDVQIKSILEFKPQIIGSFASALKNLAGEIKKKRIKGISPRLIFSTAELMTEYDRKFITDVFQAELFDYYACNECGIIAWECKEHSGYHIDSDNVIVEFIKEDGTSVQDGEAGEIVITSLNSYTMPFIRYRLGDVGAPSNEQCPCGRTLPLMKNIVGRSNDYFFLPNGKRVYPFSLMRAVRDIPGISQYQMIQLTKDKVRINIVRNIDFSHKTVLKIEENCKGVLGNNVEITINVVEEIASESSGKCQAVKSELKDILKN